jgi:hypothetical protein
VDRTLPEPLDSLLVDRRHTTPELTALRDRSTGPVALPGDAAYDELVPPWNRAVELRPRLAVGARTADDVVEAVRYARRHGDRWPAPTAWPPTGSPPSRS